MDSLWQDIKYAIRALIKSPGFTIVAVLMLALGIGASTAIFSIVEAVLLRALPYPDPAKIVRLWEQAPDGHRMDFADPNFDDFVAQNYTFANLAVYGFGLTSVSGGSEPVRANIAVVSRDFFRVLGVDPFRGRAFAPEEQRLHGTPAVIVSYPYWQRHLGAKTDLSKFHLTMEGRVYQVVAVTPAGFDFPSGVVAWIPRELDEELPSRTAHNWRGLGRVGDGFTVAQARADLSAIAHRIKDQYGKEVDLSDTAVVPLADALVGDVRSALLTLLGAVGLLLLVVCANVAGLLLARTAARRKEQRGMNSNSSPTILLRTVAPSAGIVSAAREVFHDLAPEAPLKFSTFAQEMSGWLAGRRFLFLLVGLLAAAALGLACVGIYGVVAYSVARRTHEIGIRMSLGAQRGDVLSLILGEGARMAGLGVIIGIAVSLAVTRLMLSLLFGVSVTDPLTFVAVGGLLSFATLLASYIPARQAMRVDPLVALRYE